MTRPARALLTAGLVSLTFAVALGSPHPRAVLFVKHVDGAAGQLKRELERRSDPESPDYLNWLSADEVHSLLRPRPDHLATVLRLAADHGVSTDEVEVLGQGDKVVVHFPGAKAVPTSFLADVTASGVLDIVPSTSAAAAFNVSMPPSRRGRVRPGTPSTQPKGLRSALADPQTCLSNIEGVTGSCIRTAYGLTSTASGALTAGQAFVVNQAFSQSDLAKFQSENKLPSQAVAKIVGTNSGKAGDEAALDSQ